jgi:hypothetical protein
MSSTTEYIACSEIDSMTPAQLRHHLKCARARIATLTSLLDKERELRTAEREHLDATMTAIRKMASDALNGANRPSRKRPDNP